MKTIMAMYMGNEPLIGMPNQPFYFGEVPIVQSAVQATKQSIELAREPQLKKYVMLIQGNFFVTPQFAIGILPGTSFIIYAISDSVADPLIAGVEGYFVKELDYETFRSAVVHASNKADTKACALGEAVEQAYLNFCGINVDDLKPTDQIQLTAQNRKLPPENPVFGYFIINRTLPALCLERLLAAAAMYQDIAKEIKIEEYSITVFLHTTDDSGEPCSKILYHYAKKETNEDTVRATD